jgi:hypothetical protein
MKTPEDEAFEEIERIQRTRTKWVPANKPQDEITEMAMKCGLIGMRPHLDGIYMDALLSFAKLVAAKEREACAKLCEETNDGTPYNLAEECARNIRARGQA